MSCKIVDLIKDLGRFSYSLEVIPDITEEELDNLDLEPLFFSITWHAHAHQCINLEIAPLRLANYLRNKGQNVLLHISCTNMKKDYVNRLLTTLQDKGICNLFIVLGEYFDPNKSDFKSTQDLILYIKQSTGSYFCIGVAGFPGRADKMLHLKEKVESGADFILTQAFFEHNLYDKYIMNCREMNINVPVIPGIFPFETYKELEGFVTLCKVHVPNDLMETFTKKSGNEVVANLILDMIEKFQVKHFHLFTLNKIERTANLLNKLILKNDENK